MPTTAGDATQRSRDRMARVESLIQDVERLPDAGSRERVRELLQSVLDLHADAINRMLERVAATGPPGHALIDAMAADEVVNTVLVLHGLHPDPLELRIRQALDQVRPLLHSHGGDVEVVSLVNGELRLRLKGSCDGCSSSAATFHNAIQAAIYASAPDLVDLILDGVATPVVASPAIPRNAFVPIESLYANRPSKPRSTAAQSTKVPVVSDARLPIP